MKLSLYYRLRAAFRKKQRESCDSFVSSKIIFYIFILKSLPCLWVSFSVCICYLMIKDKSFFWVNVFHFSVVCHFLILSTFPYHFPIFFPLP